MRKITSQELFFLTIILFTSLTTILIVSKLDGPNETSMKVKLQQHANNERKDYNYSKMGDGDESKLGDNDSWEAYSENWNGEILVLSNLTNKTLTFTDKYRKQMELKGLHPLNLKHKYLRDRIERVDKYCNEFPSQTNGVFRYMVGLFRIRFNDKTSLLQCAVLKVSSTTWQKVLADLGENSKGAYSYLSLFQKISIEYNHDNAKITAKRFQTYTKFMIARNPFQRLLSGYTDKFITHQGFGENFVYGIITSNYLSNLTVDQISQMREELKTGRNNLTIGLSDSIIQQIKRLDVGKRKSKITFLEFLNFLVYRFRTNGVNGLDEHWAPITRICDPCSIKYDIIANFETLYEDSEIILDYVQKNISGQKVYFPERNPFTSNDRCNEAFRKIPLKLRRELYEIFEQDYLMFDYEYREQDENNNFC